MVAITLVKFKNRFVRYWSVIFQINEIIMENKITAIYLSLDCRLDCQYYVMIFVISASIVD